MEHSTVGSLLRSDQAFCGQLCRKETLQYGIAYYSERFADLPEANQFREVAVEDPARFPAAFEEAERWFSERGLRCHRWAPIHGQPTDELADFLISRGFERRVLAAMKLTDWVDLEPATDVRIVPARAMRAALRETFLAADTPTDLRARELLADACNERLDDPQFDMSVAVVEGRPAGRCALYQVGDIARVMPPALLPDYAGGQVATALLAHVLALAKRLLMRKICAQLESGDPAQAAFEQAGFAADGEIVEFQHIPSPKPDQSP
jgi:N-acetylglutamate synthase-like GNAT family acetyltransferase